MLTKLRVLFGAIALGCIAFGASAQTAIAPNNAGIIYSPYNWAVTSGSAQTVNSGAYLRTLFSGSSVTLNFNLTNNLTPTPEIYYRVDGYSVQSPWTKANIAASIVVSMPADTAPFPYHYLEVVVKATSETINRWNAPSNAAVTFTGLTLASSSTVVLPALLGKKILFIGDSITEGVRAVTQSATNDTDNNDSMMGWAYQQRDLLGAEVGIVGFSGAGLTVTGKGNVPPLPSTYNMLYAGQARSFVPAPDLIVLNEGTNDSTTNTVPAMVSVLNGLIAASPASKIVVMRPFGGLQVANLQAAIAQCSSPGRVTYLDTTGFFNLTYGTDTLNLHPSGPNNLAFIGPLVANALRPFLSNTAVRGQSGFF